jgi:hypothetical protein
VDGVTVTVVRGSAFISRAITFKILIDGQLAGRVANDETVQVQTGPGRHAFQITQLMGYKSKTIEMDCEPGQQITLRCQARMSEIELTMSTYLPPVARPPTKPNPPPPAAPTPAPVVPSLFVSYSHEDRGYVRDLVQHLGTAGLPVWYDHSIHPGQSFSIDIERAIDSCFAFAVVLSPDSVASQWVRQELSRARRLGKPIWPLMLRDCNPPLEVEGLQVEPVHGGAMPSRGFVEGLRGLWAPQW